MIRFSVFAFLVSVSVLFSTCVFLDDIKLGLGSLLGESCSFDVDLVISHFGFEGRTLVLIVSVSGHCISLTFFQNCEFQRKFSANGKTVDTFH